jgi:hypothetical protein
MIKLLFLSLLLVAGLCCVAVAEGPAKRRPAMTQHEADAAVLQVFPEELAQLGRAGAASDADGLLNENRQWGALYSPRFQMDGGTALRVGLAQGKHTMSRAGFRAILVATRVIAPDGHVVSRLPKRLFPGFVPSTEDEASGAAFFLADACSAVLAASGRQDEFSEKQDWITVVDALGRAVVWLEAQEPVLVDADRGAPNRLLFDALAFQSCNAVAGRRSAVAGRFAALALRKYREVDGVFVEGGGADTTYQAVSARLALALLLAGYDEPDAEALWQAQVEAARWLAARVRDDGSVDSAGNTRTCGGGESFMGKRKRLSVKTVFQALAYTGVVAGDDAITAAAHRVADWARKNPRADACL